jgi:hypothetical protein
MGPGEKGGGRIRRYARSDWYSQLACELGGENRKRVKHRRSL